MPQPGVALNALFSLRKGTIEEDFFRAFQAFYQHLYETGYVCEYRFLKRLPLAGFSHKLPDFDYQIIIEFADPETEAACYEYIRKKQEPVRSLHFAMNSKVAEGAQFYLTASR